MSTVRFEVHGTVGVITLDRPPVNAINLEVVTDLDAAVSEAGTAPVGAVVLTGSPQFSYGADIKEFASSLGSGSDQLARGLSAAVRRLELLPKPLIAAVAGYALGGGLEVAMGADLIYLAEDAKVGQPEIKLGIIPGAGGTQRLPRLVGVARAKDLIYSGRMVDAAEALAIGIAAKVVPMASLLDVAMSDAATLAAGPGVALGAAKRAINEGTLLPMDEGLAVESEGFDAAFTSRDAAEGLEAFTQKRDPRFTGD